MVSFVCRTRKHVGNGAAQDRSDDAEHDRPEDCHVHLHPSELDCSHFWPGGLPCKTAPINGRFES